MKLFAQKIPSILEINILDYSNYCPKCKVFENHIVGECGFCENPICKKENMYYLSHTKKLICFRCRLLKLKSTTNPSFTMVIQQP